VQICYLTCGFVRLPRIRRLLGAQRAYGSRNLRALLALFQSCAPGLAVDERHRPEAYLLCFSPDERVASTGALRPGTPQVHRQGTGTQSVHLVRVARLGAQWAVARIVLGMSRGRRLRR
jgi:hypothetical protein